MPATGYFGFMSTLKRCFLAVLLLSAPISVAMTADKVSMDDLRKLGLSTADEPVATELLGYVNKAIDAFKANDVAKAEPLLKVFHDKGTAHFKGKKLPAWARSLSDKVVSIAADMAIGRRSNERSADGVARPSKDFKTEKGYTFLPEPLSMQDLKAAGLREPDEKVAAELLGLLNSARTAVKAKDHVKAKAQVVTFADKAKAHLGAAKIPGWASDLSDQMRLINSEIAYARFHDPAFALEEDDDSPAVLPAKGAWSEIQAQKPNAKDAALAKSLFEGLNAAIDLARAGRLAEARAALDDFDADYDKRFQNEDEELAWAVVLIERRDEIGDYLSEQNKP